MKSNRFLLIALLALALLALTQTISGCKGGETEIAMDTTPYDLYIPDGFSQPTFPDDNHLTKARVALGKALFYDPRLSRDSTISCGSCHKTDRAFADVLAISPGVKDRKGFRNAPTLMNVLWHPYFFREGGSPSLEMQAIGPIENPDEMDMTGPEVIARLANDQTYREMSFKAYGRELDIFALTRALASYERILISGHARYDMYIHGDTEALNANEIAGMNLFFSEKTKCSSCHSGQDFTAYEFLNNGLQSDYTSDLGLARKTTLPEDIGKFKVPSLRNIALTSPYMHDGRLESLDDVVAHYNSGGQSHPNKDARIQPLGLTQAERDQLVAFFKALTDTKLGAY